jgi:hypothetical protein
MSGIPSPNPSSDPHPCVILIDPPSTADEVINVPTSFVDVNVIDPPNAPFASVKVSYRPRGEYFIPFLQPS